MLSSVFLTLYSHLHPQNNNLISTIQHTQLTNAAWKFVKNFGLLLGYTIISLLLLVLVMYVMYAVVHGQLQSESYGPEGLGDDIFYKAAETIVLLTFFAKRGTLKLNYRRILNTKPAILLKAGNGIVLAVVALLFITGVMLVFDAVHLTYNPSYSIMQIGLYFVLFVLVGFSEEFLIRGVWLEYLSKHHSRVTAIITSSLVFACLHLANNGITWLSFVNLFLAGVCLAQIYLLTKNIWLATFFHLGWNFFQGPILGFAVSGLPMASVFVQPAQHTANMINGGAFGLEGSILDTVVSLVIIVVLEARARKENPEVRARNQEIN